MRVIKLADIQAAVSDNLSSGGWITDEAEVLDHAGMIPVDLFTEDAEGDEI